MRRWRAARSWSNGPTAAEIFFPDRRLRFAFGDRRRAAHIDSGPAALLGGPMAAPVVLPPAPKSFCRRAAGANARFPSSAPTPRFAAISACSSAMKAAC